MTIEYYQLVYALMVLYTNIVDVLPDGDISDYKYIDGEYVYDPLPEPEPQPVEPTADDVLDVLLGIGGNANE